MKCQVHSGYKGLCEYNNVNSFKLSVFNELNERIEKFPRIDYDDTILNKQFEFLKWKQRIKQEKKEIKKRKEKQDEEKETEKTEKMGGRNPLSFLRRKKHNKTEGNTD